MSSALLPDVTGVLHAIEAGDAQAAQHLLPLVYDELRNLAAAKLAHERPGQTLQPTALVHEAYLRLVGQARGQVWDSRGHFFAAAAEAMRRILIENARRKRRQKRGGALRRVEFDPAQLSYVSPAQDLLDLNDALDALTTEDPQAAQFVKLRYFAGLSIEEAADMVGLSRSAACAHWAYARAWLHRRLRLTGDERGADIFCFPQDESRRDGA
jgi:RNA polymerase sigma factor (TIGR02999 family)